MAEPPNPDFLATEETLRHERVSRDVDSPLAEHLEQLSTASRLEAVESVVAAFGSDSKLYSRFYSFDVVKCTRARRRWVAPDQGSFRELIPAEAVPEI